MFQTIALAFSIAVSAPVVQDPHSHRSLEMIVVSKYTFEVTVETIKRASTAEKYGVQGVHKMSEILTEKGFPRDNLVVIEVCNPKGADDALNNDVLAGLMMPCPVMVWEEGGKVLVATFDTRVMAKMYRGNSMAAVGESVYRSLRKILASVDKAEGKR